MAKITMHIFLSREPRDNLDRHAHPNIGSQYIFRRTRKPQNFDQFAQKYNLGCEFAFLQMAICIVFYEQAQYCIVPGTAIAENIVIFLNIGIPVPIKTIVVILILEYMVFNVHSFLCFLLSLSMRNGKQIRS